SLLAQFLALVVEPLTEVVAAAVRVNKDLHAVEPVSARVVAGSIAVTCDFDPGMRLQRNLAAGNEGRAVTDDLVVNGDDELALGKNVDLPCDCTSRITFHAS